MQTREENTFKFVITANEIHQYNPKYTMEDAIFDIEDISEGILSKMQTDGFIKYNIKKYKHSITIEIENIDKYTDIYDIHDICIDDIFDTYDENKPNDADEFVKIEYTSTL